MPIVGASLRGMPASYERITVSFSDVRLVVVWVYLQFCEREASTCSHTAVVFDGRTANDRSELVDWAGGYCSSFGETGIAATRFSTGL